MKKKVADKKKYNADDVIKHLADNDRHYEVNDIGENVIEINIEWGDWKHDHGYCDYLMEQIGFVRTAELVTEEDGSDCYSSIHRYANKEWLDRINRVSDFIKRNFKQED